MTNNWRNEQISNNKKAYLKKKEKKNKFTKEVKIEADCVWKNNYSSKNMVKTNCWTKEENWY